MHGFHELTVFRCKSEQHISNILSNVDFYLLSMPGSIIAIVCAHDAQYFKRTKFSFITNWNLQSLLKHWTKCTWCWTRHRKCGIFTHCRCLDPSSHGVGHGFSHNTVHGATKWQNTAAMLNNMSVNSVRLIFTRCRYPAPSPHHVRTQRKIALISSLRLPIATWNLQSRFQNIEQGTYDVGRYIGNVHFLPVVDAWIHHHIVCGFPDDIADI